MLKFTRYVDNSIQGKGEEKMKKIVIAAALSLGIAGASLVASNIYDQAGIPTQHSVSKEIELAGIPTQHSPANDFSVLGIPTQH